MSYLDEAVIDIDTDIENGQMYVVIETETVDPSQYDADEYAERKYRRDNSYNGMLMSVVQEVDDGFHVAVMEQSVEEPV